MFKLYNYLKRSCNNDIIPEENIIYKQDGSCSVIPDKDFYFKIIIIDDVLINWGNNDDFTYKFKTINGTIIELYEEIDKLKNIYQSALRQFFRAGLYNDAKNYLIYLDELDSIKKFVSNLEIYENNIK